MRRAIFGLSALAATAALALAAPAFAQEEWAGRGDYGWGGFGGYGRGVVPDHDYGSWGQERVRRDGNTPYRAYNSGNGYRRYDGDYGWGDVYFECRDCGYRAAYRRYGGYWMRPSDYYAAYYWGGGYRGGWRHRDRDYDDDRGYGRRRCYRDGYSHYSC